MSQKSKPHHFTYTLNPEQPKKDILVRIQSGSIYTRHKRR